MRYSVKDVAGIVGLTVSQTRRRLHAIEADLDGDLSRGSRGKLLLSDRGLSLFRRVVELEKDSGLTCRDAVMVVREETGKTGQERTSTSEKDRNSRIKVAAESESEGAEIEVLRVKVSLLEKRAYELEKDRDAWRDMALALPAPRRRSWFGGLFRRRRVEAGE